MISVSTDNQNWLTKYLCQPTNASEATSKASDDINQNCNKLILLESITDKSCKRSTVVLRNPLKNFQPGVGS